MSSAALQTVGEIQRAPSNDDAWQRDGYTYNELVGEVGFVNNLTANTVAAADLRIVRSDEKGDWVESTDPRAQSVMDAFVGPIGGIEELLRRASLHMQIAGESWLVGTQIVDEFEIPLGILWEFLSTEEVKVDADGNVIRNPSGTRQSAYGSKSAIGHLDEDVYIARLWRSDPRWSDRADSPMKRVLPICREVVVLTQVVDAIAKSRLSAGILFIPDEMSFGPDNETEDPGDDTDDIDEFMQELISHLSAPVDDRTSAAALVPLLLRGAAELGDKVQLIEIARDLDNLYQELRQEALHRVARGLDIPPEMMEGKGSLNHWCVTDDHEILTVDRGWVTHDQLHPGDMVRTLNHVTGLSEWQPVLDMYRADVVDEPMVSIEGQRHSSLTTPNHRWPTLHGGRDGRERVWTTTDKLNTLDSIIVAAPSADQPTEAKWSDGMVELAAWLWTEGHIRFREGRRSPQVTIWQSSKVNADNVTRIRRALTAVFGAASESLGHGSRRPNGPGWVEHARSDRPTMTEFRLNAAAADVVVGLFSDPVRKVVNPEFVREMTAAQIELFIDASIRADGTVLAAGTLHLAQADADRLTALELAATLSGRSTSIYSVANSMTMLSISAKTTFGVAGKKVTDTTYSGTIWCPVTENQSWFARRNGKTFYTGNTGYNIDSEFASKHVIPLGEALAEFITTSYFRPMLVQFEGFTEEEAEAFALKFDPSSITSKPEPGMVRGGWDRRVVSDLTYLRSLGLDEDAMPDEEEKKRRWLEAILESDPALWGPIIMPVLHPDTADLFAGIDLVARQDEVKALPSSRPIKPPSSAEIETDDAPALVDGMGEPDSPTDSASTNEVSALIERLAVAADAALERALERAANRVLPFVNGDEELRSELRSTEKIDVLSKIGSARFNGYSVTTDEIMEGAWDSFALKGRAWIRRYLVQTGAPDWYSEEQSAAIISEVTSLLQQHAMSSLRRPLSRGDNGLLVPNDLIQMALESARRVPVA